MTKSLHQMVSGAVVLCFVCGIAAGADKYWSGSGTWSTGTAGQWSTTSGSGYGTSTWQDGDSAVFEGSVGTVTVNGTVNVSNITFTAASGGYDITGGNLSFVSGAVIDQSIQHIEHTISSPIEGSPDVQSCVTAGANYKGLIFSASSGTQTLGAYTLPRDDAVQTGDKGGVTLRGTSSTNTIESIAPELSGDRYAELRKLDTGVWSIGDVTTGIIDIDGGTLLVNGTMNLTYSGLDPIPSGARLGGNITYYKADARSGHFRVSGGGIVAPGHPAISNGVGTISVQHDSTGTPQPVNVFNDGSIYEWDVGLATNDRIHFVYGANTRTLDLDDFVLKIQDAGGEPASGSQLTVFSYGVGVTVDMTGFSNDASNFDVSGLNMSRWITNNLSLTDNGSGLIYLTGLSIKPPGTVFLFY